MNSCIRIENSHRYQKINHIFQSYTALLQKHHSLVSIHSLNFWNLRRRPRATPPSLATGGVLSGRTYWTKVRTHQHRSRWWQLKHLLFSPLPYIFWVVVSNMFDFYYYLRKISNLTSIFFSNGLKPPTSRCDVFRRRLFVWS